MVGHPWEIWARSRAIINWAACRPAGFPKSYDSLIGSRKLQPIKLRIFFSFFICESIKVSKFGDELKVIQMIEYLN